MEFSSEVARRLKESIKENENKPRKIEKITKYPDTKVLENNVKHNFLENLEKKTFSTPANLLCVRYFRLIPSNPSQPRKNTFGFNPGKRANQSHHNPSNSLTVRLPTQSDPTFVDNNPIKRDPSLHCSFTHEMSKRARNTRWQASSSREETMEEKVRKFGLFDYEDHQMNYDNLVGHYIHPRDVVDWEFLSNKVGLYSERESRDVATLSGQRRAKTVNSTHLFWPSIGDDRFNVGNTKAKSIRDPRIKLAHRCIMMTIMGRKETTNRVTEIDLFYLYCIFGEGVVCNIPYWLAKYLKGVRDKSVIFGGMFVTKIARSFGLLTEEMVSVLNREPPPHVYRKKSLVMMGVNMELHKGECCWPVTRGIIEKEKGNDEEGDREGGNEGAGGSTDIYWNMSEGDWQVRQARWIDQQDHPMGG
ncbi:hypothetical protein Tco_0942066 [Tanacetum coccineum]|uniref:Uncharacterized protein n=1 Tax=Tanacetum coccineum TaxID=301880 RepID=A0ABQ5DSM5_9ASTR